MQISRTAMRALPLVAISLLATAAPASAKVMTSTDAALEMRSLGRSTARTLARVESPLYPGVTGRVTGRRLVCAAPSRRAREVRCRATYRVSFTALADGRLLGTSTCVHATRLYYRSTSRRDRRIRSTGRLTCRPRPEAPAVSVAPPPAAALPAPAAPAAERPSASSPSSPLPAPIAPVVAPVTPINRPIAPVVAPVPDEQPETPPSPSLPPPPPDPSTRIAFAREVDPDSELTMNLFTLTLPSGTTRQVTSRYGYYAYAPSWSADGRRLAVETGGDTFSNIATMNADGSAFTTVTPNTAGQDEREDFDPDLSDDGSQVVYRAQDQAAGTDGLRIRDLASGLERVLTDEPSDGSPDWSRGGEIAFGRGGDIFGIRPDGSGLRLVATGASEPVWSPDGRSFAFSSDRSGNPEIYVMRADGTQIRGLTGNPARDVHPTWSPDGKRIAWQRDSQVWVMGADASGKQMLIDDATHPDWGTVPR